MNERIDVLAQLRTTYCPPECLAAVAELIEAASHRVANSFEEARDMDDRKENPIWCEVDVLNPCWVIGRPITTPLRHWGWTPGDVGDGWNACPQCRLRAALARVGAP